MDTEVQRALLQSALAPENGPTDFKGRPKRIWNAVEGMYFVGVSVNVPEPEYNCYPEQPPDGELLDELRTRADRTIDDLLNE